jgi:hypothetical protein
LGVGRRVWTETWTAPLLPDSEESQVLLVK